MGAWRMPSKAESLFDLIVPDSDVSNTLMLKLKFIVSPTQISHNLHESLSSLNVDRVT